MNHPNIVQIFDVGESDGRPYLAMALVEGVSLARFLKVARAKKVQLPLPIVRLIATGLLEGLAYAHTLKGTRGEELGVIHRDVTPSNLLLSTAGSVMLNDFGIAKAAINEHQTRPGTVRGKFAYVAPEQAHRGRLTLRADLFSASVTLWWPKHSALALPVNARVSASTSVAARSRTKSAAASSGSTKRNFSPVFSSTASRWISRGRAATPDFKFEN